MGVKKITKVIKFICVITMVLLQTACSLLPTSDEWSLELPQRDFFIDAYQADTAVQEFQTEEDYLFWVRRFYNGVNVVPGWLGISEQVLEKLVEPQISVVEARLYSLGLRIGSEWAKDNRVRLLNSRSANVWRDALLEALDRDELDAYLDILDKDVNDLLSGRLENDDVYFERYYEDEF